jgi:hypothetical protein
VLVLSCVLRIGPREMSSVVAEHRDGAPAVLDLDSGKNFVVV